MVLPLVLHEAPEAEPCRPFIGETGVLEALARASRFSVLWKGLPAKMPRLARSPMLELRG